MLGGQPEGGGCNPYSISSSGFKYVCAYGCGGVCRGVCVWMRENVCMLHAQSKSPLQQPLQGLNAVTKKMITITLPSFLHTPPSYTQQMMRGNKCSHTHTHTPIRKYMDDSGAWNDRNKKDRFPPKRQYEGDVLIVHLKFLPAFHLISECLGLAPLKAKRNKSCLLLVLRPL